jgi:D-alanyl-D-alanine carboxypeptidase/D-alanyl-D-alanine-endopeptidase (penicillin-binding protein 4)
VETVEPALSAIAVSDPPPLAQGNCGDWRTALGARSSIAERVRKRRSPAATSRAAANASGGCRCSITRRTSTACSTRISGAGGRFGRVEGRRGAGGRRSVRHVRLAAAWDVVRDVNKLSNNVMARSSSSRSRRARSAAGHHRARDGHRARVACKAQPAMPELVLDNGSGLSRRERISAESLARLLIARDASPCAKTS